MARVAVRGDTALSQRGYGIEKAGNEALVAALRRELTVTPRTAADMAPPAPFPLFRESSKKLYVPRAFGLARFGPPAGSTLSAGEDAPGLAFQGDLRAEQREPVEAFLSAAADPAVGGGVINVGCGFGKTACGLFIAAQLGKKTLVICHKEFLMNQWRERIAQFLPGASVGLIKQAKVDVDGRDIVLASLQSLAMRQYPDDLFARFGLVVIDECHHTSAEVFSRALHRVTAPAMLGLSATLDRKDGLRCVFEWFLGAPVFAQARRPEVDMRVRILRYLDEDDAAYREEKKMWGDKLNTAAMVTTLCNHKPRTAAMLDALEKAMRAEPGRRALVLSERRAHLKAIEKEVLARGMGSVGYYVGGMNEKALKESEGKDVILATYSMASEGMDIPALNTLLLASPISSIEQSVGRIQRQKPHERTRVPLCIDVWDDFSLFRPQGFRRMAFYKRNGYAFEGRNKQLAEQAMGDRQDVPDFEEDDD
jgi:superfamily II DNA or RNA helicase